MDDSDTSGGTLYDSSSYDNHGTINGGVTTSVSGKIGDAFDFDGSEGTGITMGLSSPPPTTLCGWVNLDSTSAEAVVVNNPGFGGQNLYVQSGDAIAEVILDNNDNSIQARSSVSTGNWYHLVAVLDSNSGQVELYVNGQEKSSQSWDGTYDGDSNIDNIGTDELNAPEQPLDGKIDDVRVYNRALSANEVSALYNMRSQRQKTSDLQKGLVGHWTLDAGATSNGTAYDSSANDNHGTLNGGVTTGVSGQVGEAYTLNGTDGEVQASGLVDSGESISCVGWFKKNVSLGTSGTGDRMTLIKQISPDWHPGIWYNGGQIRAHAQNGTDGIYEDVGWVQDQNWHQIGSVYDSASDTINVVLDGEIRSGSRSTFSSSSGISDIYLGSENDSTYQFSGEIDDVRVYNRVLSADEINRLYNKR
jgi:hypothetical protein